MSRREIWRLRKAIQRKYQLKGKVCKVCGSKEHLERHHKTNDLRIEKIEILCDKCHAEHHAKVGVMRYAY
jgi:hypothetical protein